MPDDTTATIEEQQVATEPVDDGSDGAPEQEQTEATEQQPEEPKGLSRFKELYERHSAIERGEQPPDAPDSPDTPDTSKAKDTQEQTKDQAGDADQPDYSEVLQALDGMDVSESRKQAFRNNPVEAAEQAIKRDAGKDGIPTELLENWKRNDPERFVAYGLKRMGVQAHQDQLFGRAQAEGQQQAQPHDDGNATATQPADLDWDELVKPLAMEYGQEIVEPLKAFGQAIHGNAAQQVQQYQNQLAYMGELLHKMNGERVNQRIETLRERLGENDYPQLKDDDAFNRVADRYDVLVKGGTFQTVDDAFRVACAMELDSQRREDIKKELLQKQQRMRKSRASARSVGDTGRAMTKEQKGVAALRKMAKQHDMDLR